MKILVIYDSAYGNTEQLAKTLTEITNSHVSVRNVRVTMAVLADLQNIDVLIVGSPTQGGMATKPIQEFIATIANDSLKNVGIAAFDTRYALSEHGIGLKVLMKTIGFGAPRIATALQAKGGTLLIKPEGFLVENKEGPLKDGELERASDWMQEIITKYERS